MISSTNAQGTTTYSYNALGERVKKSGPGGTVLFAYDEEGHLIGEYTGTGALIQEIVWFEGLPVASLRPAAGGGIEIFNISSDHLGTPRVIRRATDGVVVWRWDSDPFGVASPNENPSGAGEFKFNLRFPGQYADSETGLNYNYFRDYNPKTGRYVQSDPIGLNGGMNTYAYTTSNPLFYQDPTGTIVPLPLAAYGGLSGAYGGYLTGGWQGALVGAGGGMIVGLVMPTNAGAFGSLLGGIVSGGLGQLLGNIRAGRTLVELKDHCNYDPIAAVAGGLGGMSGGVVAGKITPYLPLLARPVLGSGLGEATLYRYPGGIVGALIEGVFSGVAEFSVAGKIPKLCGCSK